MFKFHHILKIIVTMQQMNQDSRASNLMIAEFDLLKSKVESQAALIVKLEQRVAEQKDEILNAVEERINQRMLMAANKTPNAALNDDDESAPVSDIFHKKSIVSTNDLIQLNEGS